ncbi:MAG: TRAP transporter small permease [Clostridiales bacterium]|nr:TRAP transporter small permease [Clostridiales bacterium]
MKTLVKISNKLDAVLRCISAMLMVMFFVIMLLQVILRNLFPAYTLSWADGACRYAFIWATFLGAPLATKSRSQITITFIIDRFGEKTKKIMNVVLTILTSIVLILLIIWGIRAIGVTAPQKADALPISAATIYAAIPVGIALLLFQTVVCTLEDVFSKDEIVYEKEEID